MGVLVGLVTPFRFVIIILMVHVSTKERDAKAVKKPLKGRVLIIIFLTVVLVAGVVYGVWFVRQQGESLDTVDVPEEVQEDIQNLNLLVDTDLAQRYAIYIANGDPDSAKEVFSTRVAAESDSEKKAELLEQQVSLAIAYTQQNHAESAVQQLVEVRPDHYSYSEAARVYAVSNDYDRQSQYLKRAISAAHKSDDERKAEYIGIYEERLRTVESVQKLLRELADET